MQTIYAFSYNPSIATGTNTTKTVWRMAYQQPILLYKGTANSIKLVIYNNAQKVVDLTDYDVQVQIVDKDTQEHFVTRTATIDTPSNGVATVTFTEADLRNLQHRFYHIIARLMPPNDGSTQVAGEILYLDDNYGAFTPVTIEDAWNFDPTNISTTDGNASITFTSIGETPNSFSGFGGNYLRVNTAEDSLEFVEAVTPVLTSVDNIIPSTNNTYYLGNVDHQWHSLYSGNVKVGNITISGSNISTAPSAANSLILTANRHTITFSDNSVGNQGVGAVMQFDDILNSPGPRIETWYGNVATPSDPPGQHSLDIIAADANSYVEFGSYNQDTWMGVDGLGAFIYTNWTVDKTHHWYFGADGNFKLPNDGKITNFNGNAAVLFNANNITVVTNDADGSTIHTSSFTESGGLTLDGDLTPVGDAVHSLGTPSNQWKDLYVSNSTIYLGGVPVSVDAGGNLLVNGNTVSGGGAANTGNITFSVATLSTSGTNQDMTLDPNGTGNVVVAANINASGNITSPRFISNIATGTAPFSVTSTTQVANLNVANAGHAVTADSATTATSATTAGTVTTAAQPNITSVGTLSTLTVSGFTSLGPIGNVQITGGSNGQYLRTNGAGVLSWATVTGGGAANTGNITFVDNSITSTNTNEDIVLDPNGTGKVNVNHALQIIAPNGQVQGGLYTSGDADYLNIAADNGRGLKFFVNLEDGGITIHPNGVLATTGQVTTINNNTDFTIRTVNSTGPVNHDYIFGSDGVLTLPKGTEIRDIGTPGSTSGLELGNHGFTVDFGSAANDWAIFYGANLIQMQPGAAFNITFPEVANWEFNSAGNIVFPDGTTQSTAFNLDNIDISGNTISSINTNGDITLDPNGTGAVVMPSGRIELGNIQSEIASVASSSGDGNGYSTLKLIPDVSRINTDAYIILDPTAPDHIHIRAGGTQDASTAVLILGGEDTNVSVIDGNGKVIIRSLDTNTSSTYAYEFTGNIFEIGNGRIRGFEGSDFIVESLYPNNLNLAAQNITGVYGGSGQQGGNVNVTAAMGSQGDINVNSGGRGGNVNITAGAAGTANGTSGNVGGHVNITSGITTSTAAGGNINITAALGSTGTRGQINLTGLTNIDGFLQADDILISTANITATAPNSNLNIASDGIGNINLTSNAHVWRFSSDGAANFPGDLTIAGNITIQGGTTIVNTSDLTVEDSIINLHSQANLAPWTQDDGRDIGIAFHHYKAGADKHAYLVWQNDTSHLEYYSEGTEASGVISGTLGTIHANIFSANVATGTAPFIVKSTTQVANLNAATAGTAGTVTTAAQPNITSLGTLTALDVNAQANATIFKSNIATGTAPFIVTSTTQVANLNVATAGSATTAGTVTTAAQPNITSVGTLTGLTVSGTIDATSSANVALGAVGNVHITGGTNGYVLSTDGSGNLSWVAQSGGGGASTGNITFTTATISTSGTNENMTLDPNGTGNVSVVGGMTVTANITSPIFTSNIATGTAPFVVTSTTQVANLNVAQAGQLINGNSNVSITANSNVSIYVTGNATARAVFTSTGANIAGTANITGAVSMLSTLSVTSNANVGNIGAATAVITTAANVPLIQNGTSNIAIASGANVTISSAGTANVLTITSTGANIAGTANITGAVTMGSTLAVTGNITTSGSYGNISGANVVTANTMVTTSTTFAGLPAAATAGAGARGFITDANTTTFASQVSGGGANALPVFSNGTNWYVG